MQVKKSFPKWLQKLFTKWLLEEDTFPKAAPGSGGVFYGKGPTSHSLTVGCASRTALAGTGFGISFGGFAEVIKVLRKVGLMSTMEQEAYREATEEIPGIETIIPYEAFLERRIYLTSFIVSTPNRGDDNNSAHAPTFFGCHTTAEERKAISALPVSNETATPLEFFTLSWDPADFDAITLSIPGKLHHAHEMEAFRALARRAATGKLYLK